MSQEMIILDNAAKNAPALVGSEKQVKWAVDIRASKVAEIFSYFDRTAFIFAEKSNTMSDAEIQSVQNRRISMARNIAEKLSSANNAAWWIHNKDFEDFGFIKMLLRDEADVKIKRGAA